MDADTGLLDRFLQACRPVARSAGAAILRVADEGIDVETKEDGSPLTRADRASHEIIVSALESLEPKLPILSEEGDVASPQMRRWRTYWCVDPLDGTKEFIKGLGEYTVNIALIDRGAPVLGVVYLPVRQTEYYAARGCGAWKAAGDDEPQPLRPSAAPRPRKAVVSRSHLSDETMRYLEALGVAETISHGSSIKICAVAEGAADIYPRHGPTCLWDTAAGAAVAVEAGCDVVDLDGKPLTYDPADGIRKAGFMVYPKGIDLAPV